MPFANTSKGEYGTYFIGYASTFSTTHKMLENMFIGDPVGNTDRLLDFSTPITGTLFSHLHTICLLNSESNSYSPYSTVSTIQAKH